MNRVDSRTLEIDISVALTFAMLRHGAGLTSDDQLQVEESKKAIVGSLVAFLDNSSSCVVRSDFVEIDLQGRKRLGIFGEDEPWPAELSPAP